MVCVETLPEDAGGGAEISTFYLAKALARHSKVVDEIYFAIGGIAKSFAKELEAEGVNVIVDPALIPIYAYYEGSYLAKVFYRSFSEELILARTKRLIAKLVDQLNIDLLYAHHIYSALPVVAVAKSKNKPSLVAIRDYWPICLSGTMLKRMQEMCDKCDLNIAPLCMSEKSSSSWRYATRRAYYSVYGRYRLFERKRTLENASILVANSKFLRNKLSKFFPKRRIDYVYNPIDLDRFKKMDPKKAQEALRLPDLSQGFVITYVGPAARYKGFYVLVKAIPEILREVGDAILLFAGAIPDYVVDNLKKRFGKKTMFLGYVPPLKMPYVYAVSDIVVFPSIWPECFGRVVAEAMACSKVVVASKVGAIPEYLSHNYSGWLIPQNSPYKLAEAVIFLEKNRRKINIMGENARVIAEKLFSFSMIAREFDQILKRKFS